MNKIYISPILVVIEVECECVIATSPVDIKPEVGGSGQGRSAQYHGSMENWTEE